MSNYNPSPSFTSMAAVVPRSADIDYYLIGFGELSGPKTTHCVLFFALCASGRDGFGVGVWTFLFSFYFLGCIAMGSLQ